MYEFETFVYLDVQKTGSNFICATLRKFSAETAVRKRKHKGVEADFDKSKIYFISVRNPLEQYVSLYFFGCKGRGRLSKQIKENGLGELYDGSWSGFLSWLEFMLDSEKAPVFEPTYAACGDGRLSRLVGLQSYRVLRLAIPGANNVLSACRDENEVISEYRSNNIVSHVIKTENLRTDFVNLLKNNLSDRISDLDSAIKFIQESAPINTTEQFDKKDRPKLSEDLKSLLREREWFLCDEFGY